MVLTTLITKRRLRFTIAIIPFIIAIGSVLSEIYITSVNHPLNFISEPIDLLSNVINMPAFLFASLTGIVWIIPPGVFNCGDFGCCECVISFLIFAALESVILYGLLSLVNSKIKKGSNRR